MGDSSRERREKEKIESGLALYLADYQIRYIIMHGLHLHCKAMSREYDLHRYGLVIVAVS